MITVFAKDLQVGMRVFFPASDTVCRVVESEREEGCFSTKQRILWSNGGDHSTNYYSLGHPFNVIEEE